MYGKVDGGVIRHFEPKDLRGADQQRGFDPGCVGGKAPCKPTTEQMTQRTETAQYRRHQGAYQRPVPIRQSSKIGMRCAIFELLIQGPAAAQHAIEDLGGDSARGKAGRINSGCARGHTLNGQERNPQVSGSVVELATAR
jgi:hypothetical protein